MLTKRQLSSVMGGFALACLCACSGSSEGNREPLVSAVVATPKGGAAPLEVRFSARASDPDGDALVYIWDVADTDVFSTPGPEAVYTFVEPGLFTVRLEVSDNRGGAVVSELDIAVTDPF